MLNIIKLHWGLIKFLRVELKKKRTLKEFILFLKEITKAYFTQLLNLFKSLFLIFNAEYRKQKKQHDKYNKLKKQLNQALKLLKYIDKKMEKQGISRHKRRQFWRDFQTRGELRKEMFEELMKDIERIK